MKETNEQDTSSTHDRQMRELNVLEWIGRRCHCD